VVAVLTAVCMIGLLAVLALSLDGGALLEERRHAQATADAAALSAAGELYLNYWAHSGADPDGTASASAFATAANNGYTNDTTHTTVTVHIPPKNGLYANRTGYAEVIVEFHQRRAFSSVFARDPLPIKARAVAIGMPTAADVGILVLDKTGKSTFNAQGGGTSALSIEIVGTPIVVNSAHQEAAIAGGGVNVIAPEYFITGNYTTTGGASFTGDLYTGRPGLEDPLVDVPPPDPLTMTIQSSKKIQYTSGEMTLQPGVYKGGITVSGTGSLRLEPGIYYMDGGGFSFTGQGSLFGHNIMVYNAPGNGNADGINVAGQGSVDISGPLDGVYKGLTFFQDRNATVTGNVSGTSETTRITGTFYFAGALLKITGSGGVANLGSQYISRYLDLGGNGGIYVDWSPDKVAQKRAVHLVE
jgi:hypothetical protein